MLVLQLYIFALPVHSATWLDTPITVAYKDARLHTVLESISTQSGAVIYYDQQLENITFSGNYTDITVSEAIEQVFSRENKIIVIDEKERVITVQTFGPKHLIQAGTREESPSTSSQDVAALDTEDAYRAHASGKENATLRPIANHTPTGDELAARHLRQEQDFLHNTIAQTGPTIGTTQLSLQELEQKHRQQEREFDSLLSDRPNIVN